MSMPAHAASGNPPLVDPGFAVLSPSSGAVSLHRFLNVHTDTVQHRRLLHQAQRLRGSSYLADGAIRPADLAPDGTLQMAGDEAAWHLLLIGRHHAVIGCVRYTVHDATSRFEDLLVRHSPVISGVLGGVVRDVIERDLHLAKSKHLAFVEIGGWAIDARWRMTRAALDMIAASYALGDLWGGSLGLCTATVRHGSSTMLRKSGALPLIIDGRAMSPYQDPTYKCEMELLRFNSTPAKRFIPLVDPLRNRLVKAAVIRRTFEGRPRQDWTDIDRVVA